MDFVFSKVYEIVKTEKALKFMANRCQHDTSVCGLLSFLDSKKIYTPLLRGLSVTYQTTTTTASKSFRILQIFHFIYIPQNPLLMRYTQAV